MFKFLKKPEIIYAHCDIPCGIYDPQIAQQATLTALRMDDLISAGGSTHDIVRYTVIKEEHLERCKHEVRVIWGDYFKEEHLTKYPELHPLVHKTMQAASKARQTNERAVAEELLGLVNRFAEIFWETKGISTKRIKSPQKIEAEIVYPVL